MHRLLALLPAILLLTFAAPAQASTDNPGPCTAASALGMPNGEDHDHNEPKQHAGLYCRIRQISFLPLNGSELAGVENSKLGEMDVKADIAAVAVQEPIGGVMFFDVKDPANPKYLSTYLHAECGLGDNCGAYVEMFPDGKGAVLSVQQTSGTPGFANGTPGTIPGVALIDLTDPTKPTLSQEYATVSVQGVHTTRLHQHEIGTAAGLYMYVLQNGVGVEIARVESTPTGPKAVRVQNIPVPDADNISNVHDTFIQTDPLDNKVYLYQAGGFTFGFRVYDVTNPASPQLLGEWDLTPECTNDWYSHTIDTRIKDGKRYVTLPVEQFDFGAQAEGCTGTQSGNGDLPGTMWIIDATDFSKLSNAKETLVTTWNTPSGVPSGQLTFSAHNQQVVGDLIYLSHYHGGMFVLDASEAFSGKKVPPREMGWALPCDPRVRPTLEAGTFPHTRCDFWDVVFYKGHILAADIKGGLYSLVYEPGGSAGGSGGGGGAGGGGAAGCNDAAAPVTRLSRVKLTRRGIDVRGKTSDPGCDGRVTRVQAAVAQVKGKRCRFLDGRGRLGKTTRCSKPTFVSVSGVTPFRLKVKAKLPRGKYRVGARAIDFSGNVEKLKLKKTKVR
jgi:hypothetical protein